MAHFAPEPEPAAEAAVLEHGESAGQALSLAVPRSCICKDMIEHFKDEKTWS